MSITTAMFTGVTGLLNNGEAINVIGNNIANVNTTSFKSSRTLFSDMLYSKVGNSSQIGRGMLMQGVDTSFSQGSFQNTESVTDLAIQGNSFFALKPPTTTSPVSSQSSALLTRAGSFHVDKDLYLVNPEGYQVLDTQGNPIRFSDNADAIKTAATTYATPVTTAGTDAVAAATAFATPASDAKAAADAALTAAKALTVSGTVSQAQIDAAIAGANAAVNAAAALTSSVTDFTAAASALNSAASAVTATPSADNAVNANAANTAASGTLANVLAASKALVDAMNSAGSLLSAAGDGAGGTAASTAATTLTAASGDVTLTTASASITTATSSYTSVANETGKAFSKVLKIEPNGLVSYLGKDGVTTLYYKTSGAAGVSASPANAAIVQRLAVVSPADPGSLEKAGGNLFKPTTSAGIANTAFSLAANSPNGTSDKVMSNSLELSNVDMASQFVTLIQTQRAYSANSKTITTADEMTQEVLNLKR